MGTCTSRTGTSEQECAANKENEKTLTTRISLRTNRTGSKMSDHGLMESKTDFELTDGTQVGRVFRLTNKIVNDFIWQYMEEFTENAQQPSAESWKKFWDKHHTEDYILIRPSGNPLSLDGLIDMFQSGDITNFSDSVVAVESIKILGDGAVATMVFKSEQIFNYKGNDCDDIATWTVVLVTDQEQQRPRITNIHRAPGKAVQDVCNPSSAEPEPTPVSTQASEQASSSAS